MRLTTFTDYNLRVLMYLALDPDRIASVPEIAAAYGISEHHLTKVVHHLGRAGFVQPIRGKGGGVRLAREAAAIGLGEVVRAAEGETALVECMTAEGGDCRIAAGCALARILDEAARAMHAALDRYTLADLVGRPRPLRRLLGIAA